jgi:hypothetical protein
LRSPASDCPGLPRLPDGAAGWPCARDVDQVRASPESAPTAAAKKSPRRSGARSACREDPASSRQGRGQLAVSRGETERSLCPQLEGTLGNAPHPGNGWARDRPEPGRCAARSLPDSHPRGTDQTNDSRCLPLPFSLPVRAWRRRERRRGFPDAANPRLRRPPPTARGRNARPAAGGALRRTPTRRTR